MAAINPIAPGECLLHSTSKPVFQKAVVSPAVTKTWALIASPSGPSIIQRRIRPSSISAEPISFNAAIACGSTAVLPPRCSWRTL